MLYPDNNVVQLHCLQEECLSPEEANTEEKHGRQRKTTVEQKNYILYMYQVQSAQNTDEILKYSNFQINTH